MLISLDYDDTFTRDPDFWCQVVALGRLRGHEFVCVTARSSPPESGREPHIPMPVVCAGNEWKASAAARKGFIVNVWIDDMPQLIKPEARLTFEEEPTSAQLTGLLDLIEKAHDEAAGVDWLRDVWAYVKGHT